jgi:hypothetical protein
MGRDCTLGVNQSRPARTTGREKIKIINTAHSGGDLRNS